MFDVIIVQSMLQLLYHTLEQGVGIGVCNIATQLLMLLFKSDTAPPYHICYGPAFEGKSIFPTLFMHTGYPAV